jgi:hypothetical protein
MHQVEGYTKYLVSILDPNFDFNKPHTDMVSSFSRYKSEQVPAQLPKKRRRGGRGRNKRGGYITSSDDYNELYKYNKYKLKYLLLKYNM